MRVDPCLKRGGVSVAWVEMGNLSFHKYADWCTHVGEIWMGYFLTMHARLHFSTHALHVPLQICVPCSPLLCVGATLLFSFLGFFVIVLHLDEPERTVFNVDEVVALLRAAKITF